MPPVSVCAGCHHPDKGAAGQDKDNVKLLLSLIADDDYYYDDVDDADGVSLARRKEGGVVHWNRVHQLPDHAFFSHQWHIKAGVACQTCHGPIETMEVVEQYADLTMGWCISCHRDDNYVGGPNYDGSPESFTVGVADYDVLRARVRPDNRVVFEERYTLKKTGKKGDDHAHDDHGHGDHGHDDHGHGHGEEDHAHDDHLRGVFDHTTDDQLENRDYFTAAQGKKLRELYGKYTGDESELDLPRWRVPDLPEAHALFYHNGDLSGDELRAFTGKLKNLHTFQNAPTQCSTCHQ